ncbi:hypothetical protein F5884DRAFT_716188 [Xylogone sp. PMI_703]|nr:hypothetical protein F5884DRAFT_716188 [Xylogone sp. PMI_703]
MVQSGKTYQIDRRPRKGRPKSKTGCKTCRIRHVKCDEEKPACQKCLSTGRVCEGYGIWGGGNAYGNKVRVVGLQSSQSLMQSNFPIPSHNISQEEKMAFDYFKKCTSIELPGVLGSEFWDTLVLQASSREPAVFHAVIALGATHRGKNSRESSHHRECKSLLDPHERLALRQYNKAIKAITHLRAHWDEGRVQVALITCMLFTSIELLRGEYKAAHTHFTNGVSLLNNEISMNQRLPSFLGKSPSLLDAFTRLHIHSAPFGQSSSFLYILGRRNIGEPQCVVPQSFNTLSDARQCLDLLTNSVYYLSVQIDDFFHTHSHVPEHLIHSKTLLQISLDFWIQAFDVSLPHLLTRTSRRDTLGAYLLRLYHSMMTIMISVCIHPRNEMVYDSYSSDFLSIIELSLDAWSLAFQESDAITISSSTVPRSSGGKFMVNSGFLPPLYYTAIKCRIPNVRRKAISLLRGAPYKEGLLDGVFVAYIGHQIMEIEEGDFYENLNIKFDTEPAIVSKPIMPANVPLIPESARVHNASILLQNYAEKASFQHGDDSKADDSAKSSLKQLDLMFGSTSPAGQTELSSCALLRIFADATV